MPVNSSVPPLRRESLSQTGETSLSCNCHPFSNRPRAPPPTLSLSLSPRISGPKAKISSWHTYRARTSRRALKRNCIQPPRRISARVTLPRVPATANRSGIVISALFLRAAKACVSEYGRLFGNPEGYVVYVAEINAECRFLVLFSPFVEYY